MKDALKQEITFADPTHTTSVCYDCPHPSHHPSGGGQHYALPSLMALGNRGAGVF